MNILTAAFLLSTFAGLISMSAVSNAQVPSLKIIEAFPNLTFDKPTDIQNAGDASHRLFVAEKPGRIHVFDTDAEIPESSVFLNISHQVASGWEEGLLGFTFHPKYTENGYFYVNYITQRGTKYYTRISRFTVSAENRDKADPETEVLLLEIEQPTTIHNGGQLAFGPDGYLYISQGDGGPSRDPLNNGQNLRSLHGKILRIDVDNLDNGMNYGIPETNPFAGNTHYQNEIYAWGLRNPWRFSIDWPTGRIWAGDVGQDLYEEVNIIEKGGNYGWRITEGRHCFNPSNNCDSIGLIGPVWEYRHMNSNASITGGHVYRGSDIPELKGMYVYGDFGSGCVWALDYQGENNITNTLIEDTPLNIVAFGTDEANELYIVGLYGILGLYGRLYKLADPPGSVDDHEKAEATLHSAIPNPATDRITIPYEMNARTDVSLLLFNTMGEEIAQLVEGVKEKGKHRVEFDTTEVPAGVYYVRLTTDQTQILRKLTVTH